MIELVIYVIIYIFLNLIFNHLLILKMLQDVYNLIVIFNCFVQLFFEWKRNFVILIEILLVFFKGYLVNHEIHLLNLRDFLFSILNIIVS
jgi:hypothetical protein